VTGLDDCPTEHGASGQSGDGAKCAKYRLPSFRSYGRSLHCRAR
jgi:hypothetical protein